MDRRNFIKGLIASAVALPILKELPLKPICKPKVTVNGIEIKGYEDIPDKIHFVYNDLNDIQKPGYIQLTPTQYDLYGNCIQVCRTKEGIHIRKYYDGAWTDWSKLNEQTS